jgi:hypothetical protein
MKERRRKREGRKEKEEENWKKIVQGLEAGDSVSDEWTI